MRKLIIAGALLSLLLLTGVVSAQEETYTVQRGDTIQRIADLYDVDADALLIRNNIINPNRIRAGETLVIPAGNVSFPRQHVVQPGETLRDIANRYNTTVEALQDINRIANPNAIQRGEVLALPAVGGPTVVQPTGGTGITPTTFRLDIGDTLRSVAVQYGTTYQILAAYNNIPNPNYVQAGMIINIPPAGYTPPVTPPPTPQPPPPPQPTYRSYVVQAGDTLSEIAASYSVTLESLRQLNNITDNRRIFPGNVLLIPNTGGPIVQPPPRQAPSGVYTVQYGDTMFRIAAAFNVNVYDLAEANGILNLNSIFAGQRLELPY